MVPDSHILESITYADSQHKPYCRHVNKRLIHYVYASKRGLTTALGLAMPPARYQVACLALLSEYLLEDTFNLYFGIWLILTGLYILYKNSVLKDHRVNRRSLPFAGCSVYCFIWRWDNIKSFCVGGGIVFVPTIVLVLGLDNA